MSSLGISVCLLLLSVFISSVSQIILKKAADKTYESTLKEYMNPMVIGAYGLFFCSVILTMLALKHVPLSMSPILESTGYIFVSVMGYIFLKERFSRRKLMGFALILAGIVIFNLWKRGTKEMLVSIVIPCYNSEQTIGKVVELAIEEFEKLKDYECEFVLVNDYSRDNTWKSIHALTEKYPNV